MQNNVTLIVMLEIRGKTFYSKKNFLKIDIQNKKCVNPSFSSKVSLKNVKNSITKKHSTVILSPNKK